MAKRRVLIFSHAYYPNHVGGAEVAIKEIAKRLSAEFEFTMITLADGVSPKHERIDDIEVYRVSPGIHTLPGRVLYLLSAPLKAMELHIKQPFDCIWMMMAQYAGMAGLFFSYLYGAPKRVLTLQEGDPIPKMERNVFFIKPFFNHVFKRAHVVQTISNYLADWAKSKGVKQPIVIPNGVDVQHFGTVQPQKDEIRKKLQKKEGEYLMISAGRLVVKNGVDTMIRSLTQLPNIRLVLAGIADAGSSYGESLKTLASSLGVQDQITWLGFISHKELPAYIQACDAFARISRSEGLGNAFLEAMAAGMPVIGTDVGGIKDFLTDGITGKVVPPENSEAVAQAVKWLQSHPQETQTIVENAKKLVEENYTWDKIAIQMKPLF